MISEFFFQIAELKKLPRSGWKIKLGLKNSESVAEHSYMMSVMSMVLSDMKSLNSEKVLKMAILHDWAESKIGDFMPDQIEYDKKYGNPTMISIDWDSLTADDEIEFYTKNINQK